MHSINQYQEFISDYLQSEYHAKQPQNLYNPIHYILSLGGKKMRPVLTLMTAEVFDANYKKALPAALAVDPTAADAGMQRLTDEFTRLAQDCPSYEEYLQHLRIRHA